MTRRPVPKGVRTIPEATDLPTRLVLIRHGEAICNVSGVVGGPNGCTGLSELGVVQAQALHSRLQRTGELGRADHLYASVLPRAIETAQIVAPVVGGHAVVSDCGLCELHPGEADGLTWDQFTERFVAPDWDSNPDTLLAPGAESWTGFVSRASQALVQIVERHHHQTVVAVCHAGVIESSMLAFVPSSKSRLTLRTQHTSLTEWEIDDDGWRLIRYNDSAHLQDLPRSA